MASGERGSHQYVKAIRRSWGDRLRVASPVSGISRNAAGVVVVSQRYGVESFDAVVSGLPQRSRRWPLLSDPSKAEQTVLQHSYQENVATLHGCQSFCRAIRMPGQLECQNPGGRRRPLYGELLDEPVAEPAGENPADCHAQR